MAKKQGNVKKDQKTAITALAGMGVVGLVWWLVAKKQAISNLDYEIVSIGFNKIKNITEILALKMRVVIRIINPSSESLGFKSFVGKATYEGETIGTFRQYDPVTLKPQSTTEFSIPIQISSITLVEKLWNLMQGKPIPTTVNIKGLLKVAAMEIPIDENIDFSDDVE